MSVFPAWYKARYFEPSEFVCKCNCGVGLTEPMPAQLLVALDRIRLKAGGPLRVNSGWRCERRNARVGGVPNSRHLIGCAADIAAGEELFPLFSDIAAEFGLKAIYYRENNFVHLEVM